MLAPDTRVTDDIEFDLVGSVADKSGTPGPMSSPSADPEWKAISSTLCKLSISGLVGITLFGRGCGLWKDVRRVMGMVRVMYSPLVKKGCRLWRITGREGV